MAAPTSTTNGTDYDIYIPESAKKKLNELFLESTQEIQWCTLVPKDDGALVCPPSDSKRHFSRIPKCNDNACRLLKRSFEDIFIRGGQDVEYWDDFTLNVSHKLGLTYREIQKLNGSDSYSEAKFQQCIINPIFKEVSKAAFMIPGMEYDMIKTDFVVEDDIELQNERAGKQPSVDADKGGRKPSVDADKGGRKPSVDAVIQVSSSTNDKVLAIVPIEVKLDIDIKHYSQIACYMNKCSTAEDIRSCIMVGIIIDKKQFRLAFSVFKKGDVPLPIVHISPPIQWRHESLGSILEDAIFILTCTFLIGRIERIEITPDIESEHPQVVKLGGDLLKIPHIIHKTREENLSLSIKRRFAEQHKQIDKQQRQIDEQQKQIDELRKRLKNEEVPKPRKQKKTK